MLNKNKKLSKVNKRSNQRNNQRNNKRSNNKRSNSNKTKKYQKYITKGGGKNLCDLLKKTTQFTSKKSTTFANSFTTNEEFPDFENTNSNTELIYTGINNVGSSCYINATLQMLWSIPELRILFETSTVEDIKKIKYSEKYFIVDQNDKGVKIDYREKNIDKNAIASLFNIFSVLIKNNKNKSKHLEQNFNMTDKNYKPLLKLGHSETSIKISEVFDYHTQQDSNEMLMKILELFEKYFVDISNTFLFQEKSSVICSITKKKIVNTENGNKILTLSTKNKPSKNNISNLIENFMEIEKVDETDRDNILDACKNPQNQLGKYSHKQLDLDMNNTINLLIQLKRFNFTNGTGTKIKTVIIPDKILIINGISFKLEGCIIHLGATMSRGHYIYLVFDENSNPIKYISDDSIVVDRNYLNHTTDGYIYYYRKIEV